MDETPATAADLAQPGELIDRLIGTYVSAAAWGVLATLLPIRALRHRARRAGEAHLGARFIVTAAMNAAPGRWPC